VQVGHCAHRLVDARCLANEIEIRRTQDESGVRRQLAMELEEVPPIEGDYRAPLANREEQDLTIWPGLSRLPRISNGEYVVSESAKFLHRRLRKISSARKQATAQAASFSLICSSIRLRWLLTKAQAFARSSARREG
jgi:hypothetical protein